jgi:hypothetical protein
MFNDDKAQRGLPEDKELVSIMESRINENLTISQNWRQTEVRENFGLFEGSQWTQATIDRQISNAMPLITINRFAPVLEAICGFEIQNRQELTYLPRLLDNEQLGYNDIMNDTVPYIEQNTGAGVQYSLAFKDMLICGVGCTDTVMCYDNNPDGEAKVERVFPAFIFWDSAARAKNIVDADWLVRLKVLNQEVIREEYGTDYYDDIYNAALDARILEFFDEVLAVKTLGVVYEYQWRQKEPFYRVENPFKTINIAQLPMEYALMIEAMKQSLATKYNFNPNQDSLFSVEKASEVTELKKTAMEMFGIKLKATKQFKYKYYRAIVTGGKVVEKAENFSQTGFSVKFMTGQFSELEQCYYGLGRSCKDPQRMLNQSVSDYVGFLQTIPKGGVNIEKDAVSDIQAFINTYTKARNVTVFESGALSQGKMMPKITPPIPSGMLEMIQYADAQIMSVCGVTPELMGMMQSKEMNSSFYRQQIRQGLTTLATYFDAKSSYMRNQGMLYTDCVRVLVDNAEGRLIQNVTGQGSAKYMPLTKDRIAAEYDIIIEEMPVTPDENNATFMKLIELQSMMTQSQNPVNLMPMALEYSGLRKDVIEKLLQIMQPPPPPEPDPINTEILMSEIAYKKASAEKYSAEAYQTRIETMIKESELQYSAPKQEADINYTEAKTQNEMSKAIKTIGETPVNLTNFL